MVNIDDFIKRLENILDYYSLSASAFADKVGVQRSSLSHLLSGRNKPSLDLILKIIQNFPEVDLYWILNGKGSFPKSETISKIEHTAPILKNDTFDYEKDLFSEKNTNQKNPVFEKNLDYFSNTENMTNLKNDSEIERIVIFYKNGSFRNYKPE